MGELPTTVECHLVSTENLLQLMLIERRFWMAERTLGTHFLKGRVLDLGYRYVHLKSTSKMRSQMFIRTYKSSFGEHKLTNDRRIHGEYRYYPSCNPALHKSVEDRRKIRLVAYDCTACYVILCSSNSSLM